jgi:hypothetical protein
VSSFQALLEEEAATVGLEAAPPEAVTVPFSDYRFHPHDFIEDMFNWTPWRGEGDAQPGQAEILDHYTRVLHQLHEKRAYDRGELKAGDTKYWRPGSIIQNVIRVEAGHTVGKTKLEAGIVNHFMACFPAIAYTFAPSWEQIHDLLWKEIKVDRENAARALPGRVLQVQIRVAADHFATGRATSNAKGTGTERVQGQHHEYLLFVLDEAEGMDAFVFDAIDSMTSGGIALVLMFANPRTRASEFYRARKRPDTKSFRISCLNHPNVVTGKEVIPNAVRREYVTMMAAKHCEPVKEHSEEEYTFELPYAVRTEAHTYPSGTIWRPNSEFLFRVLGVAPGNAADRAFVPVGVYEAARARVVENTPDEALEAYLGVDMARYGNDYGTIYVRHGRQVWREAQLYQKDTFGYCDVLEGLLERLYALGCRKVSIRVDGTGGYGVGVVDEMKARSRLYTGWHAIRIHEVQFGSRAEDEKFYDIITQMYDHAAVALQELQLIRPPSELEHDLTLREWVDAKKGWRHYRKAESKDDWRRHPEKGAGRSPDDGDGFVLATAPEHVVLRGYTLGDIEIVSVEKESTWDYTA